MAFYMKIDDEASEVDRCDKCGGMATLDNPILRLRWWDRSVSHVISVHAKHVTKAFAKHNKAKGRLVIV